MSVTGWIFSILLGLFVLNNLFLAVYCRIEKKIDHLRAKEKLQRESSINGANSSQTKPSLRQKLGRSYNQLDKYFYGWMLYCCGCTGRIPSNRVRKFFYKMVFNVRLTKKTVISHGCEIRSPWNVSLGDCVIAANCLLDGRQGITVADNAVFGAGVHVWTEEHDVNDALFSVTIEHAQPVMIGPRAWICSDSTILPGTTVGEGAVVAAKACVVKDCAAFGIYGGVPAKRIGERNQKLTYHLSGKPNWHFN